MDRKKILIASSAFFPEVSPRSFRATELAKEFSRQGHQVKVITIDRGVETVTFCEANGIILEYLPKLVFKPLKIRAGIFNMVSRAITRALLLLFEYPDVELAFKYRKALRKEEGYDLLISSAVPYPVHWGVAWARGRKKKIGKVWVADCGDPYMGNRSDSFRKLFYFGYIEKFTFRRADFISIPIDTARSTYYPEFHDKIVVIPQGINFEEFLRNRPAYQANNVVTFGYAGSFIAGHRDPRLFLNFLLSLDLDYRFVIYTNMDTLVAESEKRSNGRIIVKPYIPRNQLINELAIMDFLVNIENSTLTQAPSKLIDYFLAGRPVLSVTSNLLDEAEILRFLKRDFSSAVVLSGYDKFRIREVSNSFLTLVDFN